MPTSLLGAKICMQWRKTLGNRPLGRECKEGKIILRHTCETDRLRRNLACDETPKTFTSCRNCPWGLLCRCSIWPGHWISSRCRQCTWPPRSSVPAARGAVLQCEPESFPLSALHHPFWKHKQWEATGHLELLGDCRSAQYRRAEFDIGGGDWHWTYMYFFLF